MRRTSGDDRTEKDGLYRSCLSEKVDDGRKRGRDGVIDLWWLRDNGGTLRRANVAPRMTVLERVENRGSEKNGWEYSS
jgi:hypothetical protein